MAAFVIGVNANAWSCYIDVITTTLVVPIRPPGHLINVVDCGDGVNVLMVASTCRGIAICISTTIASSNGKFDALVGSVFNGGIQSMAEAAPKAHVDHHLRLIQAVFVDDLSGVVDRVDDCAVAGPAPTAVEDFQGDHLRTRGYPDHAFAIGERCDRAGHMGAMAVAIGQGAFAADPTF